MQSSAARIAPCSLVSVVAKHEHGAHEGGHGFDLHHPGRRLGLNHLVEDALVTHMIDFETNADQVEDLKAGAYLILWAFAGFIAVIVGICFIVARWI